MIIKGKSISFKQLVCLTIYYGIAIYFPKSQNCFHIGMKFRRFLCKRIFLYSGKNINVERGARFGSGLKIEIGDYSGIGINANIPNDTKIGDYVMMGPNCYILHHNHRFDDILKPMMFQGMGESKRTIIGNDIWIGRDVLVMPGCKISDHSIIAGGCVLTKDFPKWSVVGGNPSRLLKTRK
jgi:maltose O-acetyltransferase